MARAILDKETRRAQLLAAAIAAFARTGYRRTSVTEIITEAGIARGTFYLHFKSKKEIFTAIIDEYFSKLQRVMDRLVERRITSSNYRQLLETGLRESLTFYVENRDLAKVVVREGSSIDEAFSRRWDELEQMVMTYLTTTCEHLAGTGCLREGMDPRAVALFMHGMLHAVALEYILENPDPDIEWIVQQWLEFQLCGIEA